MDDVTACFAEHVHVQPMKFCSNNRAATVADMPREVMDIILKFVGARGKIHLERVCQWMKTAVIGYGWRNVQDIVIRVIDHREAMFVGIGLRGNTQFKVDPSKANLAVLKLFKICHQYGSVPMGTPYITIDHHPCYVRSCSVASHGDCLLSDTQREQLMDTVLQAVKSQTILQMTIGGKFCGTSSLGPLLQQHKLSLENLDLNFESHRLAPATTELQVLHKMHLPNLRVFNLTLPRGADSVHFVTGSFRHISHSTSRAPVLQVLEISNVQLLKQSSIPKMVASSGGLLRLVRIAGNQNSAIILNTCFLKACDPRSSYHASFAEKVKHLKVLIVDIGRADVTKFGAEPLNFIHHAFVALPNLVTFRLEHYEGYWKSDRQFISDGSDIHRDVIETIKFLFERSGAGNESRKKLISFTGSNRLGVLGWQPLGAQLVQCGFVVAEEQWSKLTAEDNRLERLLKLNGGRQKLDVISVRNASDQMFVVHPDSPILEDRISWKPQK